MAGGNFKEHLPIQLRLLDRALGDKNVTRISPYNMVVAASDDGLEVIGRYDGVQVDKTPDGIMTYPNKFSGGDRSAFCPVGTPDWRLREVVKTLFGDKKVSLYKEALNESTLSTVEELLPNAETDVSAIDISRQLVLAVSEQVMFGIKLDPTDLAELSHAYSTFNAHSAIAASTNGFSDLGRSPKLNYLQLIEGEEPPPEDNENNSFSRKLSGLIFDSKQNDLNESLLKIASHVSSVWEHLKITDHEVSTAYKQKAEQLGLEEKNIMLELTNIIGAVISSPAGFLSFSLSVMGRLDEEQQLLVRNNSTYRHAFYNEVKRMYQPLPWFLRDITQEINVEDQTYTNGTYAFLTHSYNRRSDIWGEDADQFNPERFLENPALERKLVFFGKGKRRCPSGRFGETVATTCFETIIDRYDVHATGPLKVQISETLAPKGDINLKERIV